MCQYFEAKRRTEVAKRGDVEIVVSELVVTGLEKQPGETHLVITAEVNTDGTVNTVVGHKDGAKYTKLEGLEEKVKQNKLTEDDWKAMRLSMSQAK